MDHESLKYWIALRVVEGVGCVGFRSLLAAFPSPREVFRAAPACLRTIPGIGPVTAERIRSFRDWGTAERELRRAAELGAEIVTCEDRRYPRNLLNTHDYPPFLYVRGSLEPDELCVAVVGSRQASAYGRLTTDRISRELAQSRVTVVSGLARGIDSAAHRGALAGRGRTIAVLGSGLDILYPPENRPLASAIASRGALLSEYAFGTPPAAANFPARNRIISGIALGVVVVEAGEKSGSLITAHIAADQGRSVFAVPGEVGAAGSRGTHRLIRQGAVLVESVDEILEEILPQAGRGVQAPSPPPPPSPPSRPGPPAAGGETASAAAAGGAAPGAPEERLLALISSSPVDVDTLIAASGLAPRQVLNALLVLELAGRIRQTAGRLFVRSQPERGQPDADSPPRPA